MPNPSEQSTEVLDLQLALYAGVAFVCFLPVIIPAGRQALRSAEAGLRQAGEALGCIEPRAQHGGRAAERARAAVEEAHAERSAAAAERQKKPDTHKARAGKVTKKEDTRRSEQKKPTKGKKGGKKKKKGGNHPEDLRHRPLPIVGKRKRAQAAFRASLAGIGTADRAPARPAPHHTPVEAAERSATLSPYSRTEPVLLPDSPEYAESVARPAASPKSPTGTASPQSLGMPRAADTPEYMHTPDQSGTVRLTSRPSDDSALSPLASFTGPATTPSEEPPLPTLASVSASDSIMVKLERIYARLSHTLSVQNLPEVSDILRRHVTAKVYYHGYGSGNGIFSGLDCQEVLMAPTPEEAMSAVQSTLEHIPEADVDTTAMITDAIRTYEERYPAAGRA